MAKALGAGSGWVVLTWFAGDKRLLNQSAVDHAHGHGGRDAVLVFDMYEHSYPIDMARKRRPTSMRS